MLQWRKLTAQQRQDRCSDTSAPSCSVINNYTLTATLWSLALAQGFKYFDSMERFFFVYVYFYLFISVCVGIGVVEIIPNTRIIQLGIKGPPESHLYLSYKIHMGEYGLRQRGKPLICSNCFTSPFIQSDNNTKLNFNYPGQELTL